MNKIDIILFGFNVIYFLYSINLIFNLLLLIILLFNLEFILIYLII